MCISFTIMKTRLLKNLSITCLFVVLAFLNSCNDEELPPIENEEEVITKVDLIFDPVAEGDPLTFTAIDPDGEGPLDIETETITLSTSSSYQLFIKIRNEINNVDLTEEIDEEGEEHMIFFGFDDELFDQPDGDGNIDNRTDQVNYIDEDINGLPLGLITGWQTGLASTGDFRIVLKHQPGTKTTTSGIDQGSTDVDLTFPINIE